MAKMRTSKCKAHIDLLFGSRSLYCCCVGSGE
jgi:hypothetical protein